VVASASSTQRMNSFLTNSGALWSVNASGSLRVIGLEKTEEEDRCILAVHWYSSSIQQKLSPRLHLSQDCLALAKPLGTLEVYQIVLLFQNSHPVKDV